MHRDKQPSNVELSEDEQEKIVDWFKQLDPKLMKAFAESISMMVRAFEGRPVEPDDIITRLTNVKNILERSRFPTYALLAKQVYLRLVGEFYDLPEFTRWAELEAETLISYKGLSREEYTKQLAAASGREDIQTIMLGGAQKVIPQVKKHWWSRKPKEEESEFVHQ